MVMPKLLLTMMLLMPLILLTKILAPQTPKHIHIHLETSIMPPIMMMVMLTTPMMLPPPTLSYIPNLNVKLTPGRPLNKKNKKIVTDVDAVDKNSSHNEMNTTPHAPNSVNALEAPNKTSVRQLLDGQGYPVVKFEIIKKGFYCEAAVERCMSYLHVLSQLPGYPRYNSDRVISCNCLKLLHIDNNDILGVAQFMVDFRGMQFNSKKALYINFQNYASIFSSSSFFFVSGYPMLEVWNNTTL